MSRREIFCELENRVPPAMQPKQRRPSGPGTQVDSSATLKERFSDEILSQKILPENGVVAAREMTLCLTEIQAADGAQKIWRVWLHSKAPKNAIVQTQFLDQVGWESFRVWSHKGSTKIKRTLLGGTGASRGRLIGFKKDSAAGVVVCMFWLVF